MRFHRTVAHGDVVQVRGQLERVDEKSSGRIFCFGLYGFVDGELAYEGKTKFFIRGTSKKRGSKKPAPAAPQEPPAPTVEREQQVAVDQAIRYADASGDHNPIHVDESIAKAAGLPGCILHGLCTMALAQRDAVNQLAGGNPERLKYLSVRWAKPVFPGETLNLKVWDQGGGSYSFVTENSSGNAVITNGHIEIG